MSISCAVQKKVLLTFLDPLLVSDRSYTFYPIYLCPTATSVYMQPMTATPEPANQPSAIKALHRGKIGCTLTLKLKTIMTVRSPTITGKQSKLVCLLQVFYNK